MNWPKIFTREVVVERNVRTWDYKRWESIEVSDYISAADFIRAIETHTKPSPRTSP